MIEQINARIAEIKAHMEQLVMQHNVAVTALGENERFLKMAQNTGDAVMDSMQEESLPEPFDHAP